MNDPVKIEKISPGERMEKVIEDLRKRFQQNYIGPFDAKKEKNSKRETTRKR
jgi:hypothetical protein